MSKEAIVERILSDAGAEAEAIIKDAEEKAAAVVAAASSRAEKGRRDSEAEVKVKTGSIFERKAATREAGLRENSAFRKAPGHRHHL